MFFMDSPFDKSRLAKVCLKICEPLNEPCGIFIPLLSRNFEMILDKVSEYLIGLCGGMIDKKT